MKITKVGIRNFKRFGDETFYLDDHVVVAGPNNSGKTTLLQAIATWHLALSRWRELNDYQRHGGAYTKVPIARQAFYSVPLRAFDLLWYKRGAKEKIEIMVAYDNTRVPIEIISDSSEQVYVRPTSKVRPEFLKDPDNFPAPVFVPAMSGLSTEEPVYQKPKVNQLLGQGKPGDVLRNLLVEVHHDQDAWERLTESIETTFDYELLPPNTDGPNIISEYRHNEDNIPVKQDDGTPVAQDDGTVLERSHPTYDVASAGSGFLQVLMLLTFLNFRRGTVLLLDEPDAHLHVILQDGIYNELKTAARKNNSQLIIATHSEVVINAVEPRELYALLDTPKKLASDEERATLIRSLSLLSNLDIVQAREKGSVLYVEGHTDLALLRAWAHILGHRTADYLRQPFWKPAVFETRHMGRGIKADDHFESLLLAHEEACGVQVIDRDAKENIPPMKTAFDGKFLKLRWNRYEIESYLVHPDVLACFVAEAVGPEAELADGDAMKEVMRAELPGRVVDDPMGDHDALKQSKARVVLSKILHEAGLQNFPYTRYAEIAAVMRADEIHPEISQKLDAIADHLNL